MNNDTKFAIAILSAAVIMLALALYFSDEIDAIGAPKHPDFTRIDKLEQEVRDCRFAMEFRESQLSPVFMHPVKVKRGAKE